MGSETSNMDAQKILEVQKGFFLCTLSADAALSHPAVKEFCSNNKTNCRTLSVKFDTVTNIKEIITIDKDKSDSSHLTIDPVDIGPALDSGCAFIDTASQDKKGILICGQPSVAGAAALTAAYLCRGGIPLGKACRQLGLQWSGKKGVKPVGSIKWPHDAILPQLMTAAGAMGGQWRTPCVQMSDASARPGKFADCITNRVGTDYRTPESNVKTNWAALLDRTASKAGAPSVPTVASAAASASVATAAASPVTIKPTQLPCEPHKPDMAFLASGLLTPSECVRIVCDAEQHGFGYTNYPKNYRGNLRLITVDPGLAGALYTRLSSLAPKELVDVDGSKWQQCGLNECFRLSKYYPGDCFEMHCDAAFHRSASEQSFYTVNVYLNGNDEGTFSCGHTRFFASRATKDTPIGSVQPKRGLALVFRQPSTAHLLHDGERVEEGVKYLLRSDIMYRREDE